MALTQQQQQSVNDSGGYYDATGNWVDMSGSPGAGQGATATAPSPSSSGGGSTGTNLAGLASLAPLIANMLKGTPQVNPGALLASVPGGQDLFNSVVGQQDQQAPLRQAVTQQAMNMLPNSAFPGGRPALAPVGAGPAPAAPSTGGTSLPAILAAVGGGAGLGALLSKLAGNGSSSSFPLPDPVAALKKLFGIGQPTLSQPNAGGIDTTGLNPFNNTFTGWAQDNGGGLTPSVTTSTDFSLPSAYGPYSGGYAEPGDMGAPPDALDDGSGP